METMPAYMAKHPCSGCGTGYIQCAQGWVHNLKCCDGCDHPGRFTDEVPYSKDELIEMWKGREMPDHVQRVIAQL